MNLFVTILDGTVDMANADKAMADYIGIINERKTQEMDLRKYAEEIRKKQSFGG